MGVTSFREVMIRASAFWKNSSTLVVTSCSSMFTSRSSLGISGRGRGRVRGRVIFIVVVVVVVIVVVIFIFIVIVIVIVIVIDIVIVIVTVIVLVIVIVIVIVIYCTYIYIPDKCLQLLQIRNLIISCVSRSDNNEAGIFCVWVRCHPFFKYFDCPALVLARADNS